MKGGLFAGYCWPSRESDRALLSTPRETHIVRIVKYMYENSDPIPFHFNIFVISTYTRPKLYLQFANKIYLVCLRLLILQLQLIDIKIIYKYRNAYFWIIYNKIHDHAWNSISNQTNMKSYLKTITQQFGTEVPRPTNQLQMENVIVFRQFYLVQS